MNNLTEKKQINRPNISRALVTNPPQIVPVSASYFIASGAWIARAT